MKVRRLTLTFMAATAVLASCSKVTVDPGTGSDGDFITFYTYSAPTKAIVEDTQKLIDLNLPIWVTDASGNNPVFTNQQITHNGNGIWRSNMTWESGKAYVFYAYTYSAGSGTVTIGNDSQGRVVTISQPATYQENDSAYADYLMSYRVSANGTDKGLVQLNLERITTGVELYIAKTPRMSTVTLNSAEFKNVMRTASFQIATPGLATDTPINGMRNLWTLNSRSDQTDYKYSPTGGYDVKAFDRNSGPFAYGSEYMVMNFLTVLQPTQEELAGAERNIQLVLNYTVDEGGNNTTYEVTFDLKDYTPSSWARGHKVRYYISIDTGLDLTGSIVAWQSVDYIEGTLLPD